MLRTVRRWFGTVHVDDIFPRLERLERAELERAAEHAAMVDRLDRLYKRISARIARAPSPEDAPESTNVPPVRSRPSGESPLSLRHRLRGT